MEKGESYDQRRAHNAVPEMLTVSYFEICMVFILLCVISSFISSTCFMHFSTGI